MLVRTFQYACFKPSEDLAGDLRSSIITFNKANQTGALFIDQCRIRYGALGTPTYHEHILCMMVEGCADLSSYLYTHFGA